MDLATFRKQFPEFASVTDFPAPMLDFWATVAGNLVDKDRWSALYDVGLALCLAHHLTLARNNQAAPGEYGRISSQSVGDVSVSYDTGSTGEDRGGHWNLTTYGTQFLRMSRMVGHAVQIV